MPAHPAPLTPALLRAYLDTCYTVFAENRFDLVIAHFSPMLPPLLEARGVGAALLISAHNPFSRKKSAAENVARSAELRQRLHRENLAWVPATGQSLSTDWPAEPGFLVFGTSREQARELLLEFEQNAGVWCQADGIPQLMQHPHVHALMTPDFA